MKWVLLALLMIGIGLLIWGRIIQDDGRSPDEALGSVIPYLLGLFVLGVDVLLLAGYALWRLFA